MPNRAHCMSCTSKLTKDGNISEMSAAPFSFRELTSVPTDGALAIVMWCDDNLQGRTADAELLRSEDRHWFCLR